MSSSTAGRPPVSDAEWQQRVDLAACYRLIAHVRVGRPRVHAHLRARARPGTPLPHQPLRHVVRGDHRFQPGQDRPGRKQGDGQPLRHQPGRVHHPQRDPRRARRREVRPSRAHPERRRGLGPEERRAAGLAAVDHRARLARVPRLRRHRAQRGREAAARPRPGRQELPHAAQPRAADRGGDRSRTRSSSCTCSRPRARSRCARRPAAAS